MQLTFFNAGILWKCDRWAGFIVRDIQAYSINTDTVESYTAPVVFIDGIWVESYVFSTGNAAWPIISN